MRVKRQGRVFTRFRGRGRCYDFCSLTLDVTPHDKDLLYQLADAEQVPMSQAVRTLIREEAKRRGIVSEYADNPIPDVGSQAKGRLK